MTYTVSHDHVSDFPVFFLLVLVLLKGHFLLRVMKRVASQQMATFSWSLTRNLWGVYLYFSHMTSRILANVILKAVRNLSWIARQLYTFSSKTFYAFHIAQKIKTLCYKTRQDHKLCILTQITKYIPTWVEYSEEIFGLLSVKSDYIACFRRVRNETNISQPNQCI